ncbi:MAG: glycosyltransferase family 4 protein, partial [Perlucidibaca sp.]
SQSLRDEGVDVRLRVLRKATDLPWVETEGGGRGKLQALARPLLDTLPLRRHRQRGGQAWSVNWLPYPAVDRAVAGADLVHLHWLGFGYVSPGQIARWRQPVVWTLHDMWPVTGGCHYAAGCEGFLTACGRCPQLASQDPRDISARRFAAKAELLKRADVHFVSPSRWMADEARRSGLIQDRPVHVIANGLDLQRFQPLDRAMARQALGLPADRPVVLFGAINAHGDERKGAHLMLAAVRQLEAEGWQDGRQPLYVVFGASAPAGDVLAGLPVHHVGRLHDDVALALLYSAADVMVVPSLQETFGQTASEAMACGTPVVAFAATGLLDVVAHGETGYLAQPYEAADLAAGIRWLLADDERLRRLSAQARARCQQFFDQRLTARAHQQLYQSLLAM